MRRRVFYNIGAHYKINYVYMYIYFEPTLYNMRHSYVCGDIHYVTNVKSDFSSSSFHCSLDTRLTSIPKVYFHSQRRSGSITMAEADTGGCACYTEDRKIFQKKFSCIQSFRFNSSMYLFVEFSALFPPIS